MSSLKRENVITWDETFMQMANLIAMRSKDPSTQVGAVIVDKNNRVVSVGYNGFPNDINDDELPWGKTDENPLNTKYLYVVHAELNAITGAQRAGTSIEGCKLYVTMAPCNECAKAIIQSGISEVIYDTDPYNDSAIFVAAKIMLNMSLTKLTQYSPRNRMVLESKLDR